MLEEVLRSPRKATESTDLHRWAMLRMAINEDRCCSLVTVAKKKKKKSKEPTSMGALFRDLPSMTAVRTWKSKVGGDIRQRYGGGVEWASGLTDSAYLMYGIPRATLKRDHLIKMKQRHLRKKVTPRSINYSQSFSDYATPGQLGVSVEARDRHSMAGHSIESSVSSMSSTPSSPGAPSPNPARVPHHLPPNSVSVLPRSSPKLVNLNHVDSVNLELYASKEETLGLVETKKDSSSEGIRKNGTSSPPRVSPNSEVVRNTMVSSILESNVKQEQNNNNNSKNNRPTSDNNNNNDNSSGEKTTSSSGGLQTNQDSSTQTYMAVPEVPQIESVSSPSATLQRPVIIGQNNNNNNIFAEIDVTNPVSYIPPAPVPPAPIPPAPKIPIHKRPPQPAPKPKHRNHNKFNMAPLQAALIGSLNKRFKAPKINA